MYRRRVTPRVASWGLVDYLILSDAYTTRFWDIVSMVEITYLKINCWETVGIQSTNGIDDPRILI
jgi:hypothetical protein